MKPLPVEGHVPKSLLAPLRGKRVLITGSQGFSGRWMLETLQAADVGAEVLTIGRDEWSGFIPYFDYCAHCTTDGEGIGKIAEKAKRWGSRMLYLSSGAVYDRRINDAGDVVPLDGSVAEDSPTMPTTSYGEMKLVHERVCRDVAVIARMFSFIGPGLRRHVGREFLEADPITVRADGAVRSFLYGGDLARWLWTLLLRGCVGECYNVGGSEGFNVWRFAEMCAIRRGVKVDVTESTRDGTYYVPNTTKAEDELGLLTMTRLPDAIERTLEWQKN